MLAQCAKALQTHPEGCFFGCFHPKSPGHELWGSSCNSCCLPSQDPATLSRFGIADLLPDLQHILFWMSNAIEVLYFVQQKSPTYIQSMEEELDVKGGGLGAAAHPARLLPPPGSDFIPLTPSCEQPLVLPEAPLASCSPHPQHRRVIRILAPCPGHARVHK